MDIIKLIEHEYNYMAENDSYYRSLSRMDLLRIAWYNAAVRHVLSDELENMIMESCEGIIHKGGDD